MGRSIEVPENALRYVLYALYATALLGGGLILLEVGWGRPFTVGSVVVVLGLAVLGTWRIYRAEKWWQWATLNGAYDITRRPYSKPAQMARDSWRKAIHRLPDDEEDD